MSVIDQPSIRFDLATETEDGISVVRPSGEVDLAVSERLVEAAMAALEAAPRALLIDLSETTFLDSSGIRALLRVAQWTGEDDGRTQLALACPDGPVKRVLSITGADRSLSIHPSRERALISLSP
jgi:anti-sigma B factor antagonist